MTENPFNDAARPNAAELLQNNLTHAKALADVSDPKEALAMQQKYLEELNAKLTASARESAKEFEAAVSEAGKILEASIADAQTQARAAVENLEKEIAKATGAA